MRVCLCRGQALLCVFVVNLCVSVQRTGLVVCVCGECSVRSVSQHVYVDLAVPVMKDAVKYVTALMKCHNSF